jgi:type IV pilus assembly protein PilX
MNLVIARSDRQQGAALVVGLILLLVLTLLAVSGMSTATFELTMAGNTQYSQNAFQNAETGIEVALQSGDYNTLSSPRTPNGCNLADPVGPFCAETVFQTTTAPFDGAFSIGSFSAYHFDIDSAGRAERNAASNHTQGFYVVGPAGSP